MSYDHALPKGTTSKLIEVMVRSATTGGGLTGLAYGSVTFSYIREGTSSGTHDTCATMTIGTWATKGWVEVDATYQKGVYQFGIPDAALATGVEAVTINLQATGMIDKSLRILLLDPVRGLGAPTALPNAAAGAASGLAIVGSNMGIADGLLTAAKFGNDTTVKALHTGTAQAGAGSTITLASAAVATNAYYDGCIVQIISGTGAGQSRIITNYVGANRLATVAEGWATTPANDSVYTIHPLGDVEVAILPAIPNDWITAAGIAAGAIDFATFAADCKTGTGLKANVESISANAITAAAIAADAIGASELAADAVTEIQNGLATAAELAKVPKSDSTVTWNATALGSIVTQCGTAITNASLATSSELAKVPKSDSNVTFNSTAVSAIQNGLATPTNITAGTITTVTNLTNAPSSGDFTATMKTSLNAATPSVSVSLTAQDIADIAEGIITNLPTAVNVTSDSENISIS